MTTWLRCAGERWSELWLGQSVCWGSSTSGHVDTLKWLRNGCLIVHSTSGCVIRIPYLKTVSIRMLHGSVCHWWWGNDVTRQGAPHAVMAQQLQHCILSHYALVYWLLCYGCREWESAASKANDSGVRTVILRIGIVLAREGGALGKMLPVFQLFAGGWSCLPARQHKNCLHVNIKKINAQGNIFMTDVGPHRSWQSLHWM